MRDYRFRTTKWTLIGAVGAGDDRGRAALAELCDAYWRPVYAFIRRQGYAPDRAADLTQGVFVHLLERGGFERADPARGRFRSYLLTAVRHFLINAHEHEVAQRRGRAVLHESIDAVDAERQLTLAAPIHQSPEAAFERHWAVTTTERAMVRLAREYEARGQRTTFDDLQSYLTSDGLGSPLESSASMNGADPASGMSDDARRSALSRLRRRFADALRAEISDTVADAHDVDDELRHLLRTLTAG